MTYRKLHLYDAFAARESDTVRPGTELPPIVEIDGWHVGVMTCYDVRFPEVARSLAVRGADVIIVSAAWARGRLKERHWKMMTAARALENTCYVLACSEVSARNIGCSRVIDPLGEVIAQAGDGQGKAGGQAGMLIARLHREVLESARRTLTVLENRRFADPQLRD
nr:nitrilase-related carbon-nitrogen hydrolase [Bifidobacterium bifidum]